MSRKSHGIVLPDEWIDPRLNLVGIDGNAFAIMGTVREALKGAGNPSNVLVAYSDDATSGDYDHLLAVSAAYAGM